MSSRSLKEIKALLISCLEQRMSSLGLPLHSISDDFDMRAEGIVDSLGFVRLMTELEAHLGFEIDLADLAPEDLTVVGPLCRHIAGIAE
jgi:acyl carrier protein